MQNLIHGDCLEEMKKMANNSIDFIVTDPPYGLSFMNKKWDGKIPGIEYWTEALRICKSGSMLAAFGGSRTHHHLMLSLEQSGWEIRDVIMWLYGSGFPKSHNNFGLEGYGTALKPAYEPIILAMKPIQETYAKNVKKWGLAGINIDGCRIGIPDEKRADGTRTYKAGKLAGGLNSEGELQFAPHDGKGRWPTNIILDEEVSKMFDDKYSRFFYCAKASKKERNNGCECLPLIEKSNGNKWTDQDYRVINGERLSSSQSGPRRNFHPTVKPISIMKYIIKLLAPIGFPLLLDPFAGSGSTIIASMELNIDSIGVEKEFEYCEIAKARIEYYKKKLSI